jgi:hypothetical protein
VTLGRARPGVGDAARATPEALGGSACASCRRREGPGGQSGVRHQCGGSAATRRPGAHDDRGGRRRRRPPLRFGRLLRTPRPRQARGAAVTGRQSASSRSVSPTLIVRRGGLTPSPPVRKERHRMSKTSPSSLRCRRVAPLRPAQARAARHRPGGAGGEHSADNARIEFSRRPTPAAARRASR